MGDEAKPVLSYAGGDPVFQNPAELNLLRQRVRRVSYIEFAGMDPKLIDEMLSDRDVDAIIAATAPETREKWLKEQVDGKQR